MNRSFPLAAALVLLAGPLAAVRGTEVGYYSQPALHGDRLVIVSEGDLWAATLPEADAGPIVAWRLTSSDGSESRPVISPDGQWLAFAAEYDGNQDVYVMPIDGGAPRRVTFHPGPDVSIGWTSDSRSVLFHSSRRQPLGRPELYRVNRQGGMPTRYAFGECSMISLSPTGRRFAFTRWSTEGWSWKRYRGGMAPDVWIGDFNTASFERITTDASPDQFPMWVVGRVFFVSDRSGTANIFSMTPAGGDLQRHTTFAPTDDPQAPEGHDVRWPARDEQRRGRRVVFCQGGGLALLDVVDGTVRRLDVRLASDRVARRQRYASPMATATEFALSRNGDRLLVGARGEVILVDVKSKTPLPLSRSSSVREWGATFLGDKQVLMISDLAGEQQLAAVAADGSERPSMLTEDMEAWLFPAVTSPDRRWIAVADKTMRLHLIDTQTLIRKTVDQSDAGEITDYRFSPDGQWIAYTKPMPNQSTEVWIHAVQTGRSFRVSSGLQPDREPRWDPAGRYLYMLSDRHLNPVMGTLDFEHVFVNASQVVAIPLAADTPPPVASIARAAGFDLDAWAKAPEPAAPEPVDPDAAGQPADMAVDIAPLIVDTDAIAARQHVLPIAPGTYEGLEAVRGGVLLMERPLTGLNDERWPASGFGPATATLVRHDLVSGKRHVVRETLAAYTLSQDGTTIALPAGGSTFEVRPVSGSGDEPETLDLADVRIRVDIPGEWRQILAEAWRLQRDFYWASNYVGVDWPAMKAKYAAILPRIGTRAELNDLIGEMIGELGTSHTYVWGGEADDREDAVTVGLLGADIEHDGRGYKIARLIPGRPWGDDYRSPLAMPHLGVVAGEYLVAINGEPLAQVPNVYDLLQDQGGKVVRLTIADNPAGAGSRTHAIRTIESERAIRYADWVETNRQYVDVATDGQVGYLHIPDMGGPGLTMFSRLFYPQYDKRALVIDVRNNGGGFVSQMILERLSRRLIAFASPRHGTTVHYPFRAAHGHLAVIIDEHAGSDGDIFPAAFRTLDLGPLVGTRTWGGVVGIRGDKPFVDFGLSTQPEFAWWDPVDGWSIENEGVHPDLEIGITPGDRAADRDPQLDRAIQELLDRLQIDPKELPPRPAFPVRAGGHR